MIWTIAIWAIAALLATYGVISICWMVRLTRKFNKYLKMSAHARDLCSAASNRGEFAAAQSHIAEAEHAIRAAKAEMADFQKAILWPLLIGRWNADYYKETA